MSDPNTALEVQPPAMLAEYQEQSASMVQQREKAKIESRYIMALRAPRDLEVVRQRMIRECSRPSFCAPDMSKNGSSVAIYSVPRGGKNIEGVTIRFAEMAKRCYGHIFVEVTPLGEDENQQIYQVESTDYQNNDGGSEIVIVPKRIERTYVKDTDTVLAQRTNSKGKPVYTIVPTDDDLQVKRNALNSKARRNVIMQCIDGWLVQECIDKIRQTAAQKDAEDPGAAKTGLFDAFASIGVTASMLNEYIGHNNPLSPAELDELRSFFGGIKEGYTTWAEIAASKGDSKDEKENGVPARIEELLKESERTPAQCRTVKAKYAGRNQELLNYLLAEQVKRNNTGAKPQTDKQNNGGQQEEKKPEPAKKEAEPAKTQAQENLDAEPEAEPEPPAKQDSPKSNPAPAKQTQTGPPAPIPVSDDDDF